MKLLTLARRLSRRLGRLQLSVYAGNAAFFLLLSCCPLAILLLALLEVLPVAGEDVQALLRQLVPAPLHGLLSALLGELRGGRSPALLSASALVAIWSASRGALSILRGLNAVLGVRKTRGYLARRVLSVLGTLVTLALLVLTLALGVFGRTLAERLPLPELLSALLRRLPLCGAALLWAFFILLYRWLPDERQPFRRVWAGALAAAGGWVGFSAAFSFYVNHFCGYAALYGGLATLLLAMLWLYWCVWIVLAGALLGRLLAEGFFRGDG